MKPTIEINFRGPQGNIFYILMSACKAIKDEAFVAGDIWETRLKKINKSYSIVEELQNRVRKAMSYNDAINIIEEYVTIKPKGGLPMK